MLPEQRLRLAPLQRQVAAAPLRFMGGGDQVSASRILPAFQGM